MPVFSPSSLTETSTAIRETDLFFDMVFKAHTGQHFHLVGQWISSENRTLWDAEFSGAGG